MFWRDRYHDCECLIGGDFNVNTDGGDVHASRIVDLVSNCRLIRLMSFHCRKLVPKRVALIMCLYVGYSGSLP